MPSLPQEFIERVASHADRQTGANMLTASRSFQAAVERQAFAPWVGLEVGSLDGFLARYRGHRARFVRSVQFTVTFPNLRAEHEGGALPCRDSLEETHAYDRLFTGQLAALFTALRTFEEREADPPEGIDWAIRIGYQTVIADCGHRRHPGWRVHLQSPEQLPQLACVRSLTFPVPDNGGAESDEGLRPIDMAAAIGLTTRLPNLEELQCPYLFERFPTAYDGAVVRHVTRPWEGPLPAMPALLDAELFTFLAWCPADGAVHRWGVKAVVRGGGERRLVWQVGAWRPGAGVLGLFRHAFGNEVVMEWIPLRFEAQR